MSNYDDLPIIRCRPTPSDAELAAERERQYQAELARDEHADWPITEVVG